MPLSSFLFFLFLTWQSARANSPDFQFEILENSEIGTRVGNLLTTSDGRPSPVTLNKLETTVSHINQAYCQGKFNVDKTTGYIVVGQRPDRESMCGALPNCWCNLRLILKDDTIVTIDIRILDENDHSPAFAVPVKSITISETAPKGYEHSLDLAEDPDLPPNSVSQYSLHDASSTFTLYHNQEDSILKLVLKHRLDHEKISRYNATLDACDAGSHPRRCGTQRLTISVKDENDNAPVFEKERYEVDVLENTTMGTRVAKLRATDADARENGRVTYSVRASQKQKMGRWFQVDETTGDVYLKNKLSFRDQRKYEILVDATDHGSSPRKKTVTLTINVKDFNDHAPEISIKKLTGDRIEIMENMKTFQPVAHIIVSDNDDPKSPGGQFNCSLSRGDDYFSLKLLITDTTASIYTFQPIREFDRERITVYTAYVSCQDHGKPSLSAQSKVSVRIKDDNEHDPVFTKKNFTKSISENRHVGERVLGVSATDVDADAKLRYSLDSDGQQYFRINSERGDIFTLGTLDREVVSVINFGVRVTDADTGRIRTASASVQILVLDSNDNAPKVVGQRRFSVEENQGEYHLGKLQASDPDAGVNGQVIFRLLGVRKSKNHPLLRSNIFELTADGSLSVTRSLDRESVSQYLLEVLVHDLGNPQLNTSSTVTVDVLDENDNDPIWTHPAVEKAAIKNITDLVKPGDVITRVHARDDDVIRNVTYHLIDDAQGHFQVELLTGKLRAASLLKPGVYRLRLMASDNGENPRTAEITFTINVLHHSSANAAGSRSPMNFTLVVGMIAATCVISISLLVAIFVVRRRTLRTRRPKAELAGYTQEENLYPTNGTVYPIPGQSFYHGVPMSSFGQPEKINGHTVSEKGSKLVFSP